ncbi:MAG: hypothetical protein HYU84_11720 [Chloroflexi bacterium]|nr:hypothetical protein [Chloroflexota bacterium]MBI3169248.1 hypothetical protein [Chloroflexota bacterium]
MVLALFLLSSFFISCASPSRTAQQSQTIIAYSTSSAQPWMNDLFTCADKLSVIVNVTAEQPDISLRIGEPDILLSHAYQIDEEEILIVTHRESGVQNLSLEEAEALFSGLGDLSAQVWVYPSELDVQRLFDQFVMQGRSVTSSARVAVNPQQMSDALNAESNAVGILPRHWKAGDVREVYSVGMFPVLAIAREEPQGAMALVLACLQND